MYKSFELDYFAKIKNLQLLIKPEDSSHISNKKDNTHKNEPK